MEKDPSLIWPRCEQIGDGYGLKCKKHRIIPKGILTACYNNLHLSICTDEAIKEVRQFRQILFCRKMPYTGTVFFEEYLKMRSEAEEKLFKQIEKIRGADADAMRDAAAYVQSLAAPPGSLGKLTDAAVQLAGITGRVKNTLDRRRIIVMCADNGVVAEGVSSTPPIVTLSQALNMTRHLTGMSSLARHFGCEVEVVDIGIATPYQGKDSGILQCRIRRGTGNIANEPAMSREEAVAAILVGIERARQASKDGVDVIGVGEMGIGNTTTSSAVLAALTDLSVENVTGRGGGLTDAAFAKKKKVIARALELHGLKSISAGEACRHVRRIPGGSPLQASCCHRWIYFHRGSPLRTASVRHSQGIYVSFPCLGRDRIYACGRGTLPGSLAAHEYAAGRGQRLSPGFPDPGGFLRFDE